ncbi:MAG: hydrogenase nickel incorporation protein HypB [Anaerolineae bacterium]|nr:hydrogenase nickel incorporation protein HypB [Anaerolineae bacterium]
MPDGKTISIQENILSANDALALQIRSQFDEAGVFAVNLMASPGGGKTSLILRTIEALKEEFRIAAVDGDVVPVDIEKIAGTGIPVELINTGGSCHLDANMVAAVLPRLDLPSIDLLIIENVGNLVCPAHFALGAHANVVIASVPEGDDKPYKYPAMFQDADVLLLNKIDYLAIETFDVDTFRRGLEALNPGITFLPISCRTGEGLSAWLDWLRGRVRMTKAK